MCLLEQGRVLQSGSVASVLSRPKTLNAARAFGIFNLLPAEIMSLDPGRGTSRLRVAGQELESSYFPGHLIGDRGHLCLRESDTEVLPPGVANPAHALHLAILGSHETPQGVRLRMAGDVFALVSRNLWQELQRASEALVRLRPDATSFIG